MKSKRYNVNIYSKTQLHVSALIMTNMETKAISQNLTNRPSSFVDFVFPIQMM